MKRESGTRARYEEIALDIAQRIVQGELAEGSRVLGRSSLAGTYQVSPETVRRAVAILHERGIVQSVAGSGVRVISRFSAMNYLESVRTRTTLEEGTQELRALLQRRHELDAQIHDLLEKLLSQASGVLDSRHVEEIPVPEGAWAVGRTLYEIRLRSRTGATAVAVSRGEIDHFSPGNELRLEPGDVVTIVGVESARTNARALLAARQVPQED